MPSRFTAAVAATSLVLLGCLHADSIDDALNEIPIYVEALIALSQNKNEFASAKLREVAATELSKTEKIRVLTRIAEAEVRNQNFTGALEQFAEPGLAADPQASYWQAIALLGAERAGEAEKILAGITKQREHPHWPEATLTRISLLLRFGASEEAIRTLAPLIESKLEPYASRARLRAAEIRLSQKQWEEVATLLDGFKPSSGATSSQVEYLRGRLSLGKQEWANALAQLRVLNTPETLDTLPPNMRDGSIISLATALRQNGKIDEAVSLLQSFIDSNPESPSLVIAFDLLEEIGAPDKENIDARLADWVLSTSPNLEAIATYYLAVAKMTAVNTDAASETLETIRREFSDHPIAERALLRLSEIYVADANKTEALAVLADLKKIGKNPAVLSRIAFIEARAHYAAGEFKLAADQFLNAATSDKTAAPAATFNSAIASLKADDLDAFNQRTQLLSELGQTSEGENLLLEKALYSARQRNTDASKLLTKFLNKNPEHPRRAEAHLALAYLELTQLEKTVSARDHVEAAREGILSPYLAEEANYISFWIDIGEYKNPAAIASGEKFIQKHPDSARAPEILFKLGGIHFREGSFTAAQTHFEQLALDYPNSPRVEIARFTAGRAAMRSGTESSLKQATTLFDSVAELGGKFATSAKLQKALVYRLQLEEEKAIPILEGILKEKPTGELLFSTLISQGEALFILSSEKPESLTAAIKVFHTVAQHPDVTTYWLNQSLTRKGNCLERAGETDMALAAYEEVIGRPRPPLGEGEAPEYVWFYMAGFAAIRIYEERENWKAAINTADTLAATDGPGAQIARERSESLETKNFIWRD